MANVERKNVDKSSIKGIPIIWVMGKEETLGQASEGTNFIHLFKKAFLFKQGPDYTRLVEVSARAGSRLQ